MTTELFGRGGAELYRYRRQNLDVTKPEKLALEKNTQMSSRRLLLSAELHHTYVSICHIHFQYMEIVEIIYKKRIYFYKITRTVQH